MKNYLLLPAIAVTLFAGCASQTQQLDQWQQYKNKAQETKNLIKNSKYAEIEAQSTDLVNIAKSLLPQYVDKFPQCQTYLDAVVMAADDMLNLSVERIEADYHADGKLPKMTDVKCYHAKDLLVHPATLVVMAKTQQDNEAQRESMSHEIIEVLVHFDQVAASIN